MRFSRIIGVWAAIATLLFWNGLFALGIYRPFLGLEAGEMMAAFIAMAVIFGTTRTFLIEEPEQPPASASRIGLLWMMLTLMYEVGFGRLATWAVPRVAPEYEMWDGSFWPLIVLSSAVAPIVWLRRSQLPLERVTK
jgi:hypothetical protein